MTSDNQPILFETFALPRELLVALAAIFNTNATVPLGALIAGVYERGVDLVTYALQATGTEEPNVGKKRGKVYLQAIGALIDSLCLLKDGKAVYLCSDISHQIDFAQLGTIATEICAHRKAENLKDIPAALVNALKARSFLGTIVSLIAGADFAYQLPPYLADVVQPVSDLIYLSTVTVQWATGGLEVHEPDGAIFVDYTQPIAVAVDDLARHIRDAQWVALDLEWTLFQGNPKPRPELAQLALPSGQVVVLDLGCRAAVDPEMARAFKVDPGTTVGELGATIVRKLFEAAGDGRTVVVMHGCDGTDMDALLAMGVALTPQVLGGVVDTQLLFDAVRAHVDAERLTALGLGNPARKLGLHELHLRYGLSGPRVQGQPTQGPGTAHVRRQAPRPMDRPWQRQRVQACAVEAAATLCSGGRERAACAGRPAAAGPGGAAGQAPVPALLRPRAGREREAPGVGHDHCGPGAASRTGCGSSRAWGNDAAATPEGRAPQGGGVESGAWGCSAAVTCEGQVCLEGWEKSGACCRERRASDPTRPHPRQGVGPARGGGAAGGRGGRPLPRPRRPRAGDRGGGHPAAAAGAVPHAARADAQPRGGGLLPGPGPAPAHGAAGPGGGPVQRRPRDPGGPGRHLQHHRARQLPHRQPRGHRRVPAPRERAAQRAGPAGGLHPARGAHAQGERGAGDGPGLLRQGAAAGGPAGARQDDGAAGDLAAAGGHGEAGHGGRHEQRDRRRRGRAAPVARQQPPHPGPRAGQAGAGDDRGGAEPQPRVHRHRRDLQPRRGRRRAHHRRARGAAGGDGARADAGQRGAQPGPVPPRGGRDHGDLQRHLDEGARHDQQDAAGARARAGLPGRGGAPVAHRVARVPGHEGRRGRPAQRRRAGVRGAGAAGGRAGAGGVRRRGAGASAEGGAGAGRGADAAARRGGIRGGGHGGCGRGHGRAKRWGHGYGLPRGVVHEELARLEAHMT